MPSTAAMPEASMALVQLELQVLARRINNTVRKWRPRGQSLVGQLNLVNRRFLLSHDVIRKLSQQVVTTLGTTLFMPTIVQPTIQLLLPAANPPTIVYIDTLEALAEYEGRLAGDFQRESNLTLPALLHLQIMLDLQSGDLVVYRYEVQELLGSGTFGQVHRVRDKAAAAGQEEVYALKVAHRHANAALDMATRSAQREIWVAGHVQHDRLMPRVRSFRFGEHWCLLMPVMEMTLSQYLEQHQLVTGAMTRQILRDITAGVAVLHDNDIVHLDVKIENIFHHNGRFKVGACGCAFSNVHNQPYLGSPGTLYTRAPELIIAPNNHTTRTPKADVWSLGIVGMVMANQLQLPFRQFVQTEDRIRESLAAIGACVMGNAPNGGLAAVPWFGVYVQGGNIRVKFPPNITQLGPTWFEHNGDISGIAPAVLHNILQLTQLQTIITGEFAQLGVIMQMLRIIPAQRPTAQQLLAQL